MSALILTSCELIDLTGEFVIEEPEQIIPEEFNKDPLIFFCPEDNCMQEFIDLFENATTMDCALFDLDLPELVEFLNDKNARVVLDDHNKDEINTELNNKKYDSSSQLSHNKFCIVDDEIVWTGSFNPTKNGNYKNNNNVVVFFSKYLAENYQLEFDELWSGSYGKGDKNKYPTIILNGKIIENYFCPDDSCQINVLEELNKAEESIYFMFFSFTDTEIANTLLEKSKTIDVKGVTEKKRVNMNYEQFKFLNESGLNIKPDTNRYTMHHKVIIIDNKTVITGSYNPTKSGNTRNDENILIIHDEGIAEMFLEEFTRVWDGNIDDK